MRDITSPLVISLVLVLLTSCANHLAPKVQDSKDTNNTADTLAPNLPRKLLLDQSSKTQQVYNWLGIGYKSNAKELKGSCIEGGIWSADVGQLNTHSAYETMEKKEHVFEKMDLKGEVNVDFVIISGSAKGTYSKSKNINNYSLYLMLSIKSNLGTLSLLQPKLSKEAELLLKTQGQEAFSEKCGDLFASSVTLGGSYYAIVRFEAASAAVKKHFKAHIEGKIGVGIVSVKVSKDIDDLFTKWDKTADIHYSVIQSPLILDDIGSFQERDFVAATDDKGAYDKEKGVAKFFLLAERYADTLKDTCSFRRQSDGTYSFPQRCVQSVGLQDYFTLTTLPKDPDFAALQRKSNMIKHNGATFLERLANIQSDAWFYSHNAYLFGDASSAKVEQVKGIYDQAEKTTKAIENDLKICLRSFRDAEEARCQRYVSDTDGYNTFQKQVIDWQTIVPSGKDMNAADLPQRCDDLAQHLTLELGKAYKLFYLGAANLPYSVYCLQDPQNAKHFLEYIRLADKDGYFLRKYKEALPPVAAHQQLGTASRIHDKGKRQYTTWRYLRLDPNTMTIDLNDHRFRDNQGNVASNMFGIDSSQGLKPASAFVCAAGKASFVFSSLSLVNTDFIFDTLSLNDSFWKTESNQAKGVFKVRRFIDEDKQRLMLYLQASQQRCAYSYPTLLRVLPASYITPQN